MRPKTAATFVAAVYYAICINIPIPFQNPYGKRRNIFFQWQNGKKYVTISIRLLKGGRGFEV